MCCVDGGRIEVVGIRGQCRVAEGGARQAEEAGGSFREINGGSRGGKTRRFERAQGAGVVLKTSDVIWELLLLKLESWVVGVEEWHQLSQERKDGWLVLEDRVWEWVGQNKLNPYDD